MVVWDYKKERPREEFQLPHPNSSLLLGTMLNGTLQEINKNNHSLKHYKSDGKTRTYITINSKILFECDFGSLLTCQNSDEYQTIYDSWVASFDISLIACPNCNQEGTLKMTNITYFRYFLNTADDLKNQTVLEIAVVCCSECGKYHAILIDGILPFSSYSYRFIIRALYEYYHGDDDHRSNIARTAAFLKISRCALYKWIARYEKDTATQAVINDILVETRKMLDEKKSPMGRLELIRRLREDRAFFMAYLKSFLARSKRPFLAPVENGGTVSRIYSMYTISKQVIIKIYYVATDFFVFSSEK